MIALLDWLSFKSLIQAIRDAMVAVWDWLVNFVSSLLSPIWAPVDAAILAVQSRISEAMVSLGTFGDFLAFCNAWAPVDLFFQLLSAYSVFWLVVLTYRTVKSWIPTVSGGG